MISPPKKLDEAAGASLNSSNTSVKKFIWFSVSRLKNNSVIFFVYISSCETDHRSQSEQRKVFINFKLCTFFCYFVRWLEARFSSYMSKRRKWSEPCWTRFPELLRCSACSFVPADTSHVCSCEWKAFRSDAVCKFKHLLNNSTFHLENSQWNFFIPRSRKSSIVDQQIGWRRDEFVLTSDWREVHSAAACWASPVSENTCSSE